MRYLLMWLQLCDSHWWRMNAPACLCGPIAESLRCLCQILTLWVVIGVPLSIVIWILG